MKKYILFTFGVLLNYIYPTSASEQNLQSDYQYIFQSMDIDKNGRISPTEYFVVESATVGYRRHLTNIWKSLDTNDDNVVTPDEYFGEIHSAKKIPFSDKDGNITEHAYWFIEVIDYSQYQRHLVHFFDFMDKNQDGFLNMEAYKDTFSLDLTAIGNKYAKAIDINNDNKISKDEFLNFDFKMINRKIFDSIDANNDGFISENEFVNHIEKAEQNLTSW